MAKQKGIVPLDGTLGGITFYYLHGKPVARKAGGGFNGKAIKHKSSMLRVRENSSEFGHCSLVNKAFRLALRSFYKCYTFTFFHSRLMGLFIQLKNLDIVNARGKRLVYEGVKSTEGLTLFQLFNYTPDCDVRAVLPFNFAVNLNSFELTISEFDIYRVGFITGATHIELTYGVLDFNFETLDSELHLASPLVLDSGYVGNLVALFPDIVPNGIGTRLCVLGIRFYQLIDGDLYLLNAKNGVGLVVLECV